MSEKLHRLGIETARDLIFHWPRRYEDYTNITKISELGRFNTKNTVIPAKAGISGWIPDQACLSGRHVRDDTSIVTIKARIIGVSNKYSPRRHIKITEAVAEDGSGSIKLVWFNQPFLKNYLKPGSEWFFRGKVSYDDFGGGFAMESPMRRRDAAIIPIYPETRGINSNFLGKLISDSKFLISKIDEYLPRQILEQYKMYGLTQAITELHFPKSIELLGESRKRIAFDELLMISLRAKIARQDLKKESAAAMKIDEKTLREYTESLPFTLTGDQKKATWQIIKDLKKPMPMNRLLNGDVGSGKTVVAAIAAFATVKNGYRAALMVPTEVLATQHFETFCKLFEKHPEISIGLMTSNIKKIQSVIPAPQQVRGKTPAGIQELNKLDSGSQVAVRNDNKKKTGPQDCDIVIGTQALIQQKVELENVAMVIIDEQHRFGVKQRQALQKFGVGGGEGGAETPNTRPQTPHFLSMTATPIPRTLHLSLFGDLDISVISEKPKNRKEIKTRYVEPCNRMKAYDFIRRQIKAGRQAFVVCPLIEEKDSNVIASPNISGRGNLSDQIASQASLAMTPQELFNEDKKSVLKEYEKLRKEIFPEMKVAMLHGKMKSREKDETLSSFAKGENDILVSTSVIEVGIDVPNASVMMIEDADRFGLAQIHQFRGRFGGGGGGGRNISHSVSCFQILSIRKLFLV